jgi:hypothetical protein
MITRPGGFHASISHVCVQWDDTHLELIIDVTIHSRGCPPEDVNRLQQLRGTLLYYARAVDPTLIMPVNVLASEQTRATADTADKIIKLLNYCTTHPESNIY